MSECLVTPMFHHGGNFTKDSEGNLSYMHGKVHRWPPMDVDLINYFDLVVLFKELGYVKFKAMYWCDMTASNIESGLYQIHGDKEINELREGIDKNRHTDEFYIYFDHLVDLPELVAEGAVEEDVIASDVNSLRSSSSSSDDGYESTEDEAYKPPPPGYESDDSGSDDSLNKKMKKQKTRVKEKMSPKGRKKLVWLGRRGLSQQKMGQRCLLKQLREGLVENTLVLRENMC
ncbi:hypothetical protein Ahy_B02g057784 [Arachis hypogaea]|uniref:PB1-like domain-containing protein n=1 Tax=Arachis hypogaea TaxID=3818 RepID=A0A445ACX8_ARAHY|nr:hypothetical protein Ahy_B02g057784 [Arachis hypogaea]